jgi:hypothetical protein
VPVNACANVANVFVVGMASGLIRIFDVKDGFHLGEVQAHSRAVTAIAPKRSQAIFTSVGDDSFVNEWVLELPSEQTLSSVSLNKHVRVSN